MPKISDVKIEEIRRRSDIVDVVGRVVALKRAGRAQVGLCPFHGEKTPSFHVNPDRQIFKCFGCGKGGDVVRFVMEYHSMSFPEALQMLADQTGVTLQWEMGDPGASAGLREGLFAVNAFAADLFRRTMADEHKGAPARDYLQRRGVLPVMARRFGLGFCPDEWEFLCDALRSAGHRLDVGADAGLLVKKETGGYYDRFRGRLMFPVRNPAGKVVAFSGRVLVGDEKAKYINSSESRVFQKGEHFFGFDLAQEGIRQKKRVILCEGNLDVIMLHQHGFTEAVATLGTALTDAHVERLRRLGVDVVMMMDGDAAGRTAVRKSLELFASRDVDPRCVLLPGGDDPDAFLRREGAEALSALIDAAPTIVEFVLDEVFAAHPADAAGRARAVNAVLPDLAKVRNAVTQNLWIKTAAERGRVSEDAIRRQMRTLRRPGGEHVGPSRVEVRESDAANPEKELIRLLLHHPGIAHQATADGVIEFLTDSVLKHLAFELTALCLESQSTRELDGRIHDWIASKDEERQSELAGWAMVDGAVEERHADLAYRELRRRLAAREVEQRLDKIAEEVGVARRSGDENRELELMTEKRRLRTELDALMLEESNAAPVH